MLYRNSDHAAFGAYDRYITGDPDGGRIRAVCGICGDDIYAGEDYYSNGEMDMCEGCYRDFVKIWG